GSTALEAAYKHGEAWLDELIDVLNDHQNYVIEMFETHTKELKAIRSEGTYLIWIDCSSLEMDGKSLHTFMIEEAKVGLNPGFNYGEEGDQYMRINIACPRSTLEDGINRIITAVNNRCPHEDPFPIFGVGIFHLSIPLLPLRFVPSGLWVIQYCHFADLLSTLHI